jgi:cytidylate kinase
MKIIVSSWPGCGGTTLTVLLAEIYKLKLIRGTESFRLLLNEMNISDTGEGIILVETLIQPFFGPIYDKFMKELFMDPENDNIIADSDILGFFVPNAPGVHKIFLTGDKVSRAKHFTTDSRTEDIEVLNRRDAELRNGYKTLYGFDIYDKDQIDDHYNLVLDNSRILIAEEISLVTKLISPQLTIEQAKELEHDYWSRGKDHYLETLKKEERIMGGLEVLRRIYNKYPDEVTKFPDDLRAALQTLVG